MWIYILLNPYPLKFCSAIFHFSFLSADVACVAIFERALDEEEIVTMMNFCPQGKVWKSFA